MKIRISQALLFILAAAAPASGGYSTVEEVQDWVESVEENVINWEYIPREASFTHTTIPAIGKPTNHILGWFIQVHEEDNFQEFPVMIENYYQWAGLSSSEVFFYTPEGELVCCKSLFGTGNEENSLIEDVFYYVEGKPVMYIENNSEPVTELGEEQLCQGESRRVQSEIMLSIFSEYLFPSTCIFDEEISKLN